MELRSLYRQKRLGLKIEASGKAVDSQPTEDLKTQEIEHGISRTKDTFAQCKCSLPLSQRKDHRFFTSGGSIRRSSPISRKPEAEGL